MEDSAYEACLLVMESILRSVFRLARGRRAGALGESALCCFHAGLTKLGDPAHVDLQNTALGSINQHTAHIVERDTAHGHGGALNIRGVRGITGPWSWSDTRWQRTGRRPLHLHFGVAQDDPNPISTTHPDTFIVEPRACGFQAVWSFSEDRVRRALP